MAHKHRLTILPFAFFFERKGTHHYDGIHICAFPSKWCEFWLINVSVFIVDKCTQNFINSMYFFLGGGTKEKQNQECEIKLNKMEKKPHTIVLQTFNCKNL